MANVRSLGVPTAFFLSWVVVVGAPPFGVASRFVSLT